MSKLLPAIPPLRRLPRNTLWLIAAAVLLDEPDGDIDYPIVGEYHWVFAACILRRAIVVGAVVTGVALGL